MAALIITNKYASWSVKVDHEAYFCYFPLSARMNGGGEGSRTPVRKHFHGNFSGRRRYFTFPRSGVCRHTQKLGRVMMHGTLNSLRTHGRYSFHAPARLVALPGGTAALSSGENSLVVVL